MARLRVGDPLDKSIDIGAAVAPHAVAAYHGTGRSRARRRAATLLAALVRLPAGDGHCYYPPTLFTDVEPSSEIAQDEIFGPVLVVHDLPHARRGGGAGQQHPLRPRRLASGARTSISRSTSRPSSRPASSGSTPPTSSMPPAASAATASRGFGREGGREGMYRIPRTPDATPRSARETRTAASAAPRPARRIAIDRTAKLYVGGKQTRPDARLLLAVSAPTGDTPRPGRPLGNRKDIRNAVEAARKATGWERHPRTAARRCCTYLAENTQAHAERADRHAHALCRRSAGAPELQCSVDRLLAFAAGPTSTMAACTSRPATSWSWP